MSFPNDGRKLRPESGKHLSDTAAKLAVSEDFEFSDAITEALREIFGGSSAAIKSVMEITGAGERAVRNWFESKNAPNGENLMKLVSDSDEMLEVFLLMAGRENILAAKKLVDARDTLIQMLGLIEKLLPTEGTDSQI